MNAQSLAESRYEAHASTIDSLVVFLHGYGADGDNLLGISQFLAPHLPHTLFLAPNAPQPCLVNPGGFQWFPVPWLDGSSETQAREGMLAGTLILDTWLDKAIQREGIEAGRTCLFGFSQGTMMALHVGLQRKETLAGIIGFSGALMGGENLINEKASAAPVLLIHGDQDEVVPPVRLQEALEGLSAAGIKVESHISRGVGHEIAADGLELALEFLKKQLKT